MKLLARVLGPVQLLADGAVLDIGGNRQRRILAVLLVHRGSAASMDGLIEATFEGRPPDAAWRTFRTYVARLRRAVDACGASGSDMIVTVPSGYALAADVEVDADRFETLLAAGRRELDVGEPVSALSRIDEALALWSGSAYGEFADEVWARADAIRLDELRVVARECRCAALTDAGRHDEAIADAMALAAEQPLREEPRRLLMLALYRSGRHAEALRAGCEFRTSLAEETGLDWSPAMSGLDQMILDRDPRLDATTPGRRLRGYVLGSVIAESPSGVTYRANQPSIGRDVAITVVPGNLADDPEFVRRFEQHAQRVAAVEHPNVVPLYDYWREPGGAYLVHRFVVGGTLAERLDDPAEITPEFATAVIADIGAALAAASEVGVHHGRLTADAVLLDDAARAQLWGFHAEPVIDGRARDLLAYATLAEQLWGRVESTDGVAVGLGGRGTSVRAVTGAALDIGKGTDAFSSIGELREALLAAASGTAAGPRLEIEGPNPYRGLRAFRETDASVFFGRRSIVDQLVDDLRRDGVVAVVGPSGSGKSSVAQAGVVPAMRDHRTYVATMVPGSRPLLELEAALSRVAMSPVGELESRLRSRGGLGSVVAELFPDPESRLVLVVDQLEEAMTMSLAGERDVVFGSLVDAVRDDPTRLLLIVTARADFLGQILEHPTIGPLVRDHSRLITPLGSDELYDAIVEPAAAAGVAIEPELATALVADAIDAPGSLPLLQFALTELYERRIDGTMTLDVYRRTGGLAAPIAQRAEEVFGSLGSRNQLAARRLFSRLVTVGDGIGDARRRILRSELSMVPAPVIDAFGDARLLTFDRDPRSREPTIEIAHEAMIRRWPRLRAWIDEDRSGLITLRHLTDSSGTWEDAGRDPAELYRGSRLAAADDWADAHPEELTSVEQAFLAASRAARDDGIERERRRVRRLRAFSVVLACVAGIAVVASVIAVVQRSRADSNAREAEARTVEAERQRVVADVQRLTAESVAALAEEPDLAIRLSLEAHERLDAIGEDPPGQLIAAMQRAVQASRLLFSSTHMAGAAAISPAGDIIVGASAPDGDRLVVAQVPSGEEIRRVDVDGRIGWIEFDDSGDRIALVVGSPDGDRIRVIDNGTFEVVLELETLLNGARPEFAPHGDLLAAQTDAAILVWDLSRPGDVPTEHTGAELAGWMPDGRTIALRRGDVVHFVDATTGDERRPEVSFERTSGELGTTLTGGAALDVGLSPDGERFAVVRDDVEVWQVGDAEPVAWAENINANVGTEVFFTPDGERILQFGADDEIRVTSIESAGSISLIGNADSVTMVSVNQAGDRLLAATDGSVALWDLSVAGPALLGNLPTAGRVHQFRFSADASSAIVSEQLPTGVRTHALDLTSGSEIWTTGIIMDMQPGVASDDGLIAMSAVSPGEPGRVQRPDGTAVAALHACDQVVTMDDQGRWLLVGSKEAEESGCTSRPSRVIDPRTGAGIVEITGRHIDAGMFGPSGTMSEDLLVSRSWFEDGDGEWRNALEIRRMPTNELVWSWLDESHWFWLPSFSADGRWATVGSGGTGAYAVSIERVLAGAGAGKAALRGQGVGGIATFPDVGSGWLVFGQSGEVLRFVDLDSGREEMTLPVDSGRSTVFRITADGRALYYADGRGVLRRFVLDPDELVALARSHVRRDFTELECRRFELVDDCSTFAGSTS